MVYCFKVDFFICRKCWESGINAHSEHVRSQLIYLAILATFFFVGDIGNARYRK